MTGDLPQMSQRMGTMEQRFGAAESPVEYPNWPLHAEEAERKLATLKSLLSNLLEKF